MDDAIKKHHRSASISVQQMNEVADGETLLDHLVKQTTGTCHFAQDRRKID